VIAVLVVALLACAALAYVVLPLGQRRGQMVEAPPRVGELDAIKRSALTAIVDLEADRSVGKLSDEDFEVLRAQYEGEALRALTELDALGARPGGPDEELEAEIAAMRVRLECPRCGSLRATDGTCPQCQTTS
jgi:Zn finger protein HypA/HybF involved in hydrogenase expression